jgi:hypothetical protein
VNNAGIQAWDDSQIVYPMRFAASLTEIRPWPIDDGLDLSILKNHTRAGRFQNLSMAAARISWVAPAAGHTGTVHFADYASLPAKKIWSWERMPMELVGAKLSDNNSAYLEVQAGLFRNQETYARSSSRGRLCSSVNSGCRSATSAESRANLAGVASLVRRGTSMVAGFNANQGFPRHQFLFPAAIKLISANT